MRSMPVLNSSANCSAGILSIQVFSNMVQVFFAEVFAAALERFGEHRLLKMFIPGAFQSSSILVQVLRRGGEIDVLLGQSSNLIEDDTSQPVAKQSLGAIIFKATNGFGHSQQDFLSDVGRIRPTATRASGNSCRSTGYKRPRIRSKPSCQHDRAVG